MKTKKFNGGALRLLQDRNRHIQEIACALLFFVFLMVFGSLMDSLIFSGLGSALAIAPFVATSADPEEIKKEKALWEKAAEEEKKAGGEAALAIKKAVDEMKAKQAELEKAIDLKANAEEIKKLQEEVQKAYEKRINTLDEVMLKQGETIAELKNMQIDHSSKKGWQDNLADLFQKKKEQITSMKSGGIRSLNLDMELNKKDILAANFVDITGDGYRMPGIGQIPYRRLFMEALFSQSSQKGDAVRFVDQESIVRGATVIQGCAAYPITTDIIWRERTMPWTKIGDMIKICKDQLEDHDYVLSEVTNLLTVNVNLKVDQQLLTGTGAAGQIAGISSIADEFVAAAPFALNVESPSVYDVIVAASAQLMNASFGWFMPNYVLMNPLDVALMAMDKDGNGVYLIPPFVTERGRQVNGLVVVENSGVTQNTLFIGDFTKGKLFDRKSLFVEMATENVDDFEKDFVTIKAGRRLALVVRNVDANAFVKVSDIAAARTAITKP